MKQLLILTFLIASCLSYSQDKGYSITYYPNGDTVYNAAERTDTIYLGNNWWGIGRNKSGLREGWWEYFQGYQLMYSGTYRRGLKQGVWRSTYPAAKYNYRDNKLDGEILFYYADGWDSVIQQRRHYKMGKADGDWFTYGYDGTTVYDSRHYKNDIPIGTWFYLFNDVYYEGAVNKRGKQGYWKIFYGDSVVGGGKYVNGKQEGEWIDVPLLTEKSIGIYKNGLKEGWWKTWWGGELRSVRYYHNGQLNGADTIWIAHKIRWTSNWSDGALEGIQTIFGELGNKESEMIHDAKTRSAMYTGFDIRGNATESGKLIINPRYLLLEANNEKQFKMCVYQEQQLNLIEQGLCFWICHGLSNEKPDTDVKTLVKYFRSEQFKQDSMLSGVPWNTPRYLRTGVWTEYYPMGQKKSQGEYEDTTGIDPNFDTPVYYKTGWWSIYNEAGVLMRQEYYEHGEMIRSKTEK